MEKNVEKEGPHAAPFSQARQQAERQAEEEYGGVSFCPEPGSSWAECLKRWRFACSL